MLDRIIFIILDVLILIGIIFYLRSINKISLKNKKLSGHYMESIIVGMVSGIVVLVLDRGMTAFFQNLPKVDWQSALLFTISLIDAFIVLFFKFGLILLLVFYIIHRGLKKL